MGAISLQQLTKDFGSLRAVDGLSLEVGPGEVVGLLGPNGAGKTTALRMLAGLISPTAGRALIGGDDVASRPREARRRLGFLTASTGLYDRLTAREVLRTFGRLNGLAGEKLGRRIDEVSSQLGLAGCLDRRCGSLSSGQKQRVSIARAVVHDPEAIVLDEPTAALDPLASRSILELVQRARARGKAVLLSTHRMEEAEFLCDRLLFLCRGRCVAQGSPAAVRAQSGQSSLTGVFLHYAQLGEER